MQRAWIEISEECLKENLKQLQACLPSSCEVAPVLKANGYGHGAVLLAKSLEAMGYQMFCVACLKEAIELRQANIQSDILILGYTEVSDASYLQEYDLIQTVVDQDYAKALANTNIPIRVHLKIDTGMHRLGFSCDDLNQIEQVFTYPNLKIEGIFTHFSQDEGRNPENDAYTFFQQDNLQRVYSYLQTHNHTNLKMHSLASYGTIHYSSLKSDYARIGIALYGLLSNESDLNETKISLQPILSLKTKVSHVCKYEQETMIGYGGEMVKKDSVIATLSIGYADGVKRCLSNGKGWVMIHGQKAPIVGKICMDQMMVDVSEIQDVKQDDVATLLSNDDGAMRVYDWAKLSNTITNEVVSDFSQRLNRILVK